MVNPDLSKFNDSQKKSVAVALVVALMTGAYFLRPFFVLISVSVIVSFMFLPMYKRLLRRFSTAMSATITLLVASLVVIIPIMTILALSIVQITNTVSNVSEWMATADMGKLGHKTLDIANDVVRKIPYVSYEFTEDNVRDTIGQVAKNVGGWALGSITGILGGLFGFITTAIIFIYVFVSMLINHAKLKQLIGQLNPMGPEVTEMYLHKAGAMIHGTVGGQFVIAVIQGVTGAISIYIAGFHEAFVVLCLLFTLMSLVPLGSGIITIPFGVAMMLFGNIVGGLFVILWHIFGVTNIDNILRPILVPKTARLDPALMLVTVFAGIVMLGFWGIFIGPVLMILIVTTIKIYLAVFRNVPLDPVVATKLKK